MADREAESCSQRTGDQDGSVVRSERVGNWMQTFTGRQFWPVDPRADEIAIEDIARALAMTCRFGGHVRFHYSVAQHSFLVSLVCSPEHALWGLLHDASEAYLGDVVWP